MAASFISILTTTWVKTLAKDLKSIGESNTINEIGNKIKVGSVKY